MNEEMFERAVSQLESMSCLFCGSSLSTAEYNILKTLLDEANILVQTHYDPDPYDIMAKEIADEVDKMVLEEVLEEAGIHAAFDRAKGTIK